MFTENNSIKVNYDGSYYFNISGKAWGELENLVPKGCPFDGYSTADLLKDLIGMYSWKILGTIGNTIKIVDFIRLLQKENYSYAVTYGNDMIRVIEEND